MISPMSSDPSLDGGAAAVDVDVDAGAGADAAAGAGADADAAAGAGADAGADAGAFCPGAPHAAESRSTICPIRTFTFP
jgi:hypothetical protein